MYEILMLLLYYDYVIKYHNEKVNTMLMMLQICLKHLWNFYGKGKGKNIFIYLFTVVLRFI